MYKSYSKRVDDDGSGDTSFLEFSQMFSGDNEPLDLSCAFVDLQKKKLDLEELYVYSLPVIEWMIFTW